MMIARWLCVVVCCCLLVVVNTEENDPNQSFGTVEDLFLHAWSSIPEEEKEEVFVKLLEQKSFTRFTSAQDIHPPAPLLKSAGGAVFSSKLDTGGMSCTGRYDYKMVDVSRFGDVQSFPYLDGCTTFSDLLSLVKERFGDEELSLFWNRDASPVFLHDLVRPPVNATYKQFYIVTKAMRSPTVDYQHEERFFYPAIEPGETVTITLNDRDGIEHTVNITTLSRKPKIFFIDPFLTEEECDVIIHHIDHLPSDSNLQWEESTVGVDHGSRSAGGSYRVSSTLWLGDIHNNANEITRRAASRAQALMKSPSELMEPLQVVRYPQGGHYYFHTDSFQPNLAKGNPFVSGGGNRLATLLIYVSQPEGGGHTAFPLAEGSKIGQAGIKDAKAGCDPERSFVVPPKKGAAVLFYDLDEAKHMEGLYDPLSQHAGCDTVGEEKEKIIMNQWFRNKRVEVDGKWHMYDSSW
uniref:Fe2OG dioxygenase domain-containing protein n=1 Tax=Paramoeba aestuarina TaxID=180227 RepID=A0A7S4L6W0_9EUKA|mmetsp:Transcript_31971/g.50058  ORF Transcript_31971/g.50058 Transcript_31971/m.50058 type:complete len:463 (+) Transcript_31971:72-1460(+)